MSVLEPALYALGAILYAAHFIRREPALGRAATGALGAGVVVHTFLLGMATVRESALPLVGAGDALGGFVWLLAIVYLYVELTSGERAMGAFIAPFIAVLSLVAVASAQPGPRPAILDSPLFVFHVTFVLFAYASFAIAGGFACLTAGMLIGLVWLLQAGRVVPIDPRVDAMSLADPKILIAVGSWLLYGFQILARTTLGWSGRRTAWLSAAGFIVILVNLLPVA